MQDSETLTRAEISDLLEKAGNQTAKTADNILQILRHDPRFGNIQFNVLSNNAEVHEGGTIRRWCDADEAAARTWLEKAYGLWQKDKFADALRLLFREREYNPIINLIESTNWDGTNRCEHFLTQWGKTEDSAYTREVSRLIFAGGIHRLYHPGCKFDDVPILIGTKQGEGKSSIIRFLAVNDAWYGEVNQFDGQAAIEQLSGKWICEISELLALSRTKEVEASKAYITRAVDQYRKPYDRNVTELPRRCIFIGTTNNATPLRDVYNRRYYPVTMHTVGYDLYDHEDEIREYILQCWCEAKARFDEGRMPNYARRDLLDEYREQQDAARQDDWREGAIERYLASKPTGEFVCVRELYKLALYPSADKEPSVVDSKDIGMIMGRFDDWEKTGRHYFSDYGQQRSWQKKAFAETTDAVPFELPL